MKNNKGNLEKEFQKNKTFNKPKVVPKNDKNPAKNTFKPIQSFECQRYGHTTARCANRKEKKRGKAPNVAWDDDSDAESSGLDSPDNEFENCVTFMALSLSLVCRAHLTRNPSPMKI